MALRRRRTITAGQRKYGRLRLAARSLAVMVAVLVPIAAVRHAVYTISPLPSPAAQAAWLAGYRAWATPAVRFTELRGLREVVLARQTPEARLAARAWIPVVRQALAESKDQPWARRAAANLLGELGDPRSHVRMLPARVATKHLEYHEVTNPVATTLWSALHVTDCPPDVRGFRLRMDNPARSSSNSLTVRIGLQNDDSGDLYSVVFGRAGTVDLNIAGTAAIERHAPTLGADDDAQLELRVTDAGQFIVGLNGRSLWSDLPAWEDGLTPVIQVWGTQGGRADLAFRDIEVLRNGRWERRALRFEGGIPGLSLVADRGVTRLSGLLEAPRAQTAHAAFGFQGVRGARWSMTTADPATAALGSYFAWAMLQDTRDHAGFVQLGWGAFPPGGIGAPTFFATSGQGYDPTTYRTMWLPSGSGPLIGNAGEDGSVHRYELRVRDDGEAIMAVDGIEIYGPAAGPLYSTLMPAEPLHIAFSIEPQAVGQKLDVMFKDIEILKDGRWVRPDRADDTYAAPGLFVHDEGGRVWSVGGVHTGEPGPKA